MISDIKIKEASCHDTSKCSDVPKVKYWGRTILKVERVISPETLKKANSVIDSHPSIPNGLNKEQISMVTLRKDFERPFLYQEVIFNDQCKIEDWSDLESDLCYAPDELKALIKEAIEKMAATLEWKNTKIRINVRIFKYILTKSKPTIKGLPWHEDLNSLTMTVLISPYEQGEVGFSGGELSFARWLTEIPKLELVRREINGQPRHDESSVKTFSYPHNGGFIFDCVESQHKVNDITLVNPKNIPECKAERRLLTIFADPDKEYVRKLSSEVANNLA